VTLLSDASLGAPHLMPVEAASILRRAAAAGDISADAASMAHAPGPRRGFEMPPVA
jgi:hypothetical protein